MYEFQHLEIDFCRSSWISNGLHSLTKSTKTSWTRYGSRFTSTTPRRKSTRCRFAGNRETRKTACRAWVFNCSMPFVEKARGCWQLRSQNTSPSKASNMLFAEFTKFTCQLDNKTVKQHVKAMVEVGYNQCILFMRHFLLKAILTLRWRLVLYCALIQRRFYTRQCVGRLWCNEWCDLPMAWQCKLLSFLVR